MAKTNQTARKPVGGKAPRSQLALKAARRVTPTPLTPAQRRAIAARERRWKPIREMRAAMKDPERVLPFKPFSRFAREVLSEHSDVSRMRKEAVLALQGASEALLVELYEDANLLAIHAGRVTIKPKDLQLAAKIRGLDTVLLSDWEPMQRFKTTYYKKQ